MKGKILSILFCLVLVFGMILAACDNGVAPDIKQDPGKKVILDSPASTESGINGALGLQEPDEGGDEGGDEGEDGE